VLVLALTMFASSAAPAPAVTQMDRCLLCHPQAHPDGWEQTVHITDIKSGQISAAECTRCHTTMYCVDCHAQYTAQKQQQAGTTTP